MKYIVIWRNEIEADSPEDAVSKALRRLEPCYLGEDDDPDTRQGFQVDWKAQMCKVVYARSAAGRT